VAVCKCFCTTANAQLTHNRVPGNQRTTRRRALQLCRAAIALDATCPTATKTRD
jgi:hypothetical protein